MIVSNWNKIKDVLIVAVIPVLIWIFTQLLELETDRIQHRNMKVQVSELKSTIETLKDTDLSVAVRMAKLETRLDGISSDLQEIKTLIRGLK